MEYIIRGKREREREGYTYIFTQYETHCGGDVLYSLVTLFATHAKRFYIADAEKEKIAKANQERVRE